MNKKQLTVAVAISLVFWAGFIWTECLAEVAIISPSTLAKEADLIIVGEVKRIENGEDITKYALVAVKEVFKGRCKQCISVRFVYDPHREADVQDPNLEEEKKVLLYLNPGNKNKDYYTVTRRWSGVGRFYKGKFYHQYLVADFDKYITQLKKDIKSVPLSFAEEMQEKAVEIANKKAIELGYDLNIMIIDIDEENTGWNNYISYDKSHDFWKENPELRDKLMSRSYWAVYYGPNKVNQLGGDLWVVVDKETYQIITYLRGQ